MEVNLLTGKAKYIVVCVCGLLHDAFGGETRRKESTRKT
jgi:hypothetical protein